MHGIFYYYKRYLKIVWKYRASYIVTWFLAILLLIVYNLIPLAVGRIIDDSSSQSTSIYITVGMIALLIVLPLLIEPITFHLKTRILSNSVKDITSDAYHNIINLDYNYHVNKQTGKLISIIINSPDTIDIFLWRLEWFVLENLSSLIIPLVIILTIAPEISLLSVIILAICSPVLLWAIRVNIQSRKNLREADYARNSAIVDGVSNFETVKSFGRELYEARQFDAKLEVCRHYMNKYQDSFRLIDFVTRLTGSLLFIVTGFYVAYIYTNQSITLGTTIVLISYLSQMTNRIMGMIFSLRGVMKNIPTVEDFYNLYDAKSTISDTTSPQVINDPQGRITFTNVSFGYNQHQKIIERLSLEILPNQTVALVGSSGGGKPTLTRLLMRYYDLEQGKIEIDGVDISHLARAQLRDLIGLVPQEPVLFNRSILYNVGYALDNIEDLNDENSRTVIYEACKKAYIHDFIVSLKDGYDTIVGERGLKLSGGQKQRIAIARMLIKNPKIVIFDEATSMLDSESEKSIQLAFAELSKNKTVIIIAHRLSTITHCDNILVINNGKVAEQGKHQVLIENNGLYAKLWKIQSGGFGVGFLVLSFEY